MTCIVTGKQSMSRGDARNKVRELAPADPQGDQLNVYRCQFCGRHHVGHKRLPGDTTTPIRRMRL